MFFLHFPTALLCGELRKAWVEFVNVSGVPLAGLRVASTHPHFFTLGARGGQGHARTPLSPTASEHSSAYKTVSAPPSDVATLSLVSPAEFGASGNGAGVGGGGGGSGGPESSGPAAGPGRAGVVEVELPGKALQPGESLQVPMWLRGPDAEGVHEIHFLFYYESTQKNGKLRWATRTLQKDGGSIGKLEREREGER